MSRLISEEQWQETLARLEISTIDVCEAVYIRTGNIIKPKHIRSTLERQGRLTEPMSALFKLIFSDIENIIDDLSNKSSGS